MKFIDRLLNNTTMYRVVIYSLLAITLNAFISSAAGAINYGVVPLLASLGAILGASIVAHVFFKELFRAPANLESTIITSLILFLILEPTLAVNGLIGIAIAGIIAVTSKYLLAYKKIHLFNPAAFAAVIVGTTFIAPAFWWVASPTLIPVTLIAGLLIVRKIHRFDIFFATILASTITAIIYGTLNDIGLVEILRSHFMSGPIIFFAAIMVTEPLSTPPRRWQRIIYGTAIGIISFIPLGSGYLFTTPELTLVLANGFSFFLGLKQRLVLPLVSSKEIASQVYEFKFKKPTHIKFAPGQYLEWVLPHTSADKRGIKRYFTIASSPTEDTIDIGVKIPENASSFKQQLKDLKKGDLLFGSQLAGDFVLPKNNKPLVFIAGGIGITPFRSMIQYLIDSKEKRNITLFYTARNENEFAYKELFKEAEKIGLKTVFVVTNKESTSWKGEKGFINDEMLKNYAKNISSCQCYISGPPAMVHAYTDLLLKNGVSRNTLKTDYFPGYA